MKIIARHERDDRDIELDSDQRKDLERELGGLRLADFEDIGIVAFSTNDGWSYRLVD